MIIALVIIAIVLLCVLVFYINITNKLKIEEQQIKTSYSNAQATIERRYNTLITTVELFERHSELVGDTLRSVVAIRNPRSSLTEQTEQVQQIEQSLRVLFEQYPNIGKMFDMNEFTRRLQTIDKDVELARRTYNQEVEDYNTMIVIFPYNLFSKGCPQYEYWELKEIDTKERYNVKY